jgi:hypothetical protein
MSARLGLGRGMYSKGYEIEIRGHLEFRVFLSTHPGRVQKKNWT